MKFLCYEAKEEVVCNVGNGKTVATAKQVQEWFARYGAVFVGGMPMIKPMTFDEIRKAETEKTAYILRFSWSDYSGRISVYASPMCNVSELKVGNYSDGSLWFDDWGAANYFSTAIQQHIKCLYDKRCEQFKLGKVMEFLKELNNYDHINIPDLYKLEEDFKRQVILNGI